MTNQRIYNYKDVDMLLASKTIYQSMRDHIAELSPVRTTWTAEYADERINHVDNTIELYLGLDKRRELRQATMQVTSIQAPARRDVSFLKTQLEVDFPDQAPELLNTMGFNKNLRKVQNGDQEALIELLYAIKGAMTEELKNTITAKGTSAELIDRITGYADQLKQANLNQETLKESGKELSQEATQAFNDIYTEVIGICKIASAFYQFEPLKKEQFTFSRVVQNMNVKSN